MPSLPRSWSNRFSLLSPGNFSSLSTRSNSSRNKNKIKAPKGLKNPFKVCPISKSSSIKFKANDLDITVTNAMDIPSYHSEPHSDQTSGIKSVNQRSDYSSLHNIGDNRNIARPYFSGDYIGPLYNHYFTTWYIKWQTEVKFYFDPKISYKKCRQCTLHMPCWLQPCKNCIWLDS